MASNIQQKSNDKLVDQDALNRENNFDAGQSKVRESYLHTTGVRGTTVWVFIAILIILLVLCIINLIILAIVYGVVQIDKDGVESLSFFDNGMLRWTKPSDFETVTVYQNELGGFRDRDLPIETTENQITLHGGPTTLSSQVQINSDGNTTIIAKKGFKFVDPFAEKEVIAFDGSSSQFVQESFTGRQISMDTAETGRIVSNENEDLTLETSDHILVEGSEGIIMDGKTIALDSEGDVNVISNQGKTIKMEAKNIFLKFGTPISSNKTLCACGASGKLFTVDSSLSCDTYTGSCP